MKNIKALLFMTFIMISSGAQGVEFMIFRGSGGASAAHMRFFDASKKQ